MLKAFKFVTACAVLAVVATAPPLASDREGQGGWNFQDPLAKFDTGNNLVNKSTITWLTTDNLQATCEAESRRRGNKGFGYALEACSFWRGNSCTIITSRQTTQHALGHETLHCFQGAFH